MVLMNHKSLEQITETEKVLWFKNYLKILRMLDLHNHAAEIIKYCSFPEISSSSRMSTSYETRCGKCAKIIVDVPGWICKKCSDIDSYCGVCHTPVKGTYVWCQGKYSIPPKIRMRSRRPYESYQRVVPNLATMSNRMRTQLPRRHTVKTPTSPTLTNL